MSYEDIVKRINLGLQNGGVYHDAFGPKPGTPINEVNAWTYWQGVGVRNPKVLIVGQDWGSLNGSEKFFAAIDEIQADVSDCSVKYFKYLPEVENGGGEFATDINLVKCLSFIGYEDALHVRYPDLFFTNLVPGYRKESKSTGGFKAAWVTKQVKDDFRELVEVLNPKVIICLGKDTFKQVCQLYGKKGVLQRKNWNTYLSDQAVPVEIEDGGRTIYVFASAHPGYFGMKNRGQENVYEDWKRINIWLNK